MSRSKHLYHVIFVKVENNVIKVCADMNLWANNKRDLWNRCAVRFPGMWPFEAKIIK